MGWIFGFCSYRETGFKVMWSGRDFWFCLYRETGFKMMWSGMDFWFCLYRETLFKWDWSVFHKSLGISVFSCCYIFTLFDILRTNHRIFPPGVKSHFPAHFTSQHKRQYEKTRESEVKGQASECQAVCCPPASQASPTKDQRQLLDISVTSTAYRQ